MFVYCYHDKSKLAHSLPCHPYGVKGGVEIKLICLNTYVILCIYDNFHCSCAIKPC